MNLIDNAAVVFSMRKYAWIPAETDPDIVLSAFQGYATLIYEQRLPVGAKSIYGTIAGQTGEEH